MKTYRWRGKVLIAMAASGLGIQFIPVNRDNPPVVRELVWDSPQTRAFARRACFDCHSNQVRWPWYSYVAPVSWMIGKDVRDAREMLNFSAITPEDEFEPLARRINTGITAGSFNPKRGQRCPRFFV